MNPADVDRRESLRFWALGTLAFLLCAGTAFSYLCSMANGIAVGDLIGVRGREGDVISAQRWARFWFTTSVCCLGASSLAAAVASPIYEEAPRLPRFIARTVICGVASFALAVLIGLVALSTIAAPHHLTVR
jgi:hypothetical protein